VAPMCLTSLHQKPVVGEQGLASGRPVGPRRSQTSWLDATSSPSRVPSRVQRTTTNAGEGVLPGSGHSGTTREVPTLVPGSSAGGSSTWSLSMITISLAPFSASTLGNLFRALIGAGRSYATVDNRKTRAAQGLLSHRYRQRRLLERYHGNWIRPVWGRHGRAVDNSKVIRRQTDRLQALQSGDAPLGGH
jgi:hypothetical protein